MLFTPISVSELHHTDNLMNKEENIITLGFSLRYIIYNKLAFKFNFCLQYTYNLLLLCNIIIIITYGAFAGQFIFKGTIDHVLID